jgi:uncharacterized membrane protein
MQRSSGWIWKALILPACVGYQLLAHSLLVDGHGGAMRFALASIPLLALGYWVARHAHNKARWGLILLVAGIAIYAIEQQERLGLAATNALTHTSINLFMLWVFGRTLIGGREPLITGFARRVHGTLPPHIEAYTRRVTVAWCVFFIAQIVISAGLFAFTDLDLWSLFVNVLSLPLVATMFIGEYLYRITRYRSYPHASLIKGIQMFAEDARRRRRRPLPS